MALKSQKSLSLIIPIYNEEKLVKTSIDECLRKLDEDFEDYELIIVDDGSKDETSNILKANYNNIPNVILCPNYVNLNQGISIQRAAAIAKKDYVVHNGIDLPLDIKDLRFFLEGTEDFDVLVLQRKEYNGASKWRLLTSNINIIIRKILFPSLTKGIRDMNYVQIYKKNILSRIMPLAKSPAFTTPEMIMRARLLKLNIQIKENEFHARNEGTSSLGKLHDILWTIYDMFRFKNLIWLGLEKHGKVK